MLAGGRNKIAWSTNNGWLSLGVKDMPANDASHLNGDNMVDHVKLSKTAFHQWLLKILQRKGGRHNATGVKTYGKSHWQHNVVSGMWWNMSWV